MYWLRRMRYLLQSRGHHHYCFLAHLQRMLVCYGAVKSKEKKWLSSIFTEISPDCDCAPWHDASLVPDIDLGGHDIVATDTASADLIKNRQDYKIEIAKAFSPGR